MSVPTTHESKLTSYSTLIQRTSSPLAGNGKVHNGSTDSLSSLFEAENPHTLVGYGELKPGYIAGLLAYDSNGDLVVPPSKSRHGSRNSSPSKYSLRSGFSRTYSNSSIGSFVSYSPLSRSSSGIFEDDDPFSAGAGTHCPPYDPTFEPAGGFTSFSRPPTQKQRVLTARASIMQRTLNPAYAFTRFIGTRTNAGDSIDSGISLRSWENNPESNSSGPFGPGHGNTFPGDNGYGYGSGSGSGHKSEIEADVPAPKFRAASVAGVDGLTEALASL